MKIRELVITFLLLVVTLVSIMLWGIFLLLQPAIDRIEQARERRIRRMLDPTRNLSKFRGVTYAEQCYNKAEVKK